MVTATSRAEFGERTEGGTVTLLVWGALSVGVIAGLLFCTFPAIDLDTAGLFYKGNGVFVGKGGGIFTGAPTTIADFVRKGIYFSFVALCVLTVIGAAVSLIRKADVLGLSSTKWLFFAASLLIGPGLVGNAILKDNWGRARPVQIVEFGGQKTYSPPLLPADQCDHNCSFVAGEASMMFTTFFAAALLFPALARRLIITGVVLGLFSGLIRMSQGAHFLSDVVFAGVTMALTVAGLFLLFKMLSRRIAAVGPRAIRYRDGVSGEG
ncbi:MAG: phosphatase PAP2 family protein [Hyphomicrobium sp.]|jgi:lipid A 4'-phosphatase